MHTFDKFLGRYELEPVMGTFALVALILVVPHFFIDMLLVVQYRNGQSEFQRFYLCVHWIATIGAMIIMCYGFFALNKRSYHAISNFRSWTLLTGVFLFFSGFFSIVGFALDWHLFSVQCLEDFEKINRDGGMGHVTIQDREGCRGIYDALLTTHALLWSLTEFSLIILFVNINSYKLLRFADENRQHREKTERKLRERNRRFGIDDDDGDEEEEEEEEGEDSTHRTESNNSRRANGRAWNSYDEEEAVFARMGQQIQAELLEHQRLAAANLERQEQQQQQRQDDGHRSIRFVTSTLSLHDAFRASLNRDSGPTSILLDHGNSNGHGNGNGNGSRNEHESRNDGDESTETLAYNAHESPHEEHVETLYDSNSLSVVGHLAPRLPNKPYDDRSPLRVPEIMVESPNETPSASPATPPTSSNPLHHPLFSHLQQHGRAAY